MSDQQIRSPDQIFDDEDLFKHGGIDYEEVVLKKGDLYIIGQLWIRALNIGLLDTNWSFIPSVNAAAPSGTPEKPPPMPYKDLPIYQSPHYEYKDYLEEKFKQEQCPKYKTKILQESFYPCVSSWRKYYSNLFYEINRDCREIASDFSKAVGSRKDAFINYMRHPNNFELRTATVIAGGLTGLYIGSGTRGICRKLICTSVGLIATGALTFPEETDKAVRDFSFHTSNLIIAVFNKYYNENVTTKERVPCRNEISPPTAKRPENVCDEKK